MITGKVDSKGKGKADGSGAVDSQPRPGARLPAGSKARLSSPPSPPGGACAGEDGTIHMIPIPPLPLSSSSDSLTLLCAVVISYKSLFPMTPFSWEHAVDQAAKGLKAIKEVQCSAP